MESERIIDPLEVGPKRPKRQSRCPPQKYRPRQILSRISRTVYPSTVTRTRHAPRSLDRRGDHGRPAPAAVGAGSGRGHGHPCFLHHPKGRILLSTTTRIVCVGSLLRFQTTKATGDHGRPRRRRREFERTSVHLAADRSNEYEYGDSENNI